jgi:hypothetical protein
MLLFFSYCHISLDFVLQNMWITCVCTHFKIKKFVKPRIKSTLIFKLRVCMNVFVNLSIITFGKHLKNLMLSLELQRISVMNFLNFYSRMKNIVNLFWFSDETWLKYGSSSRSQSSLKISPIHFYTRYVWTGLEI